jgi:hypothetical protein
MAIARVESITFGKVRWRWCRATTGLRLLECVVSVSVLAVSEKYVDVRCLCLLARVTRARFSQSILAT